MSDTKGRCIKRNNELHEFHEFMTSEEYIEHVKIGGSLTEEGKQYVELRDALHAVELARNKEKDYNEKMAGNLISELHNLKMRGLIKVSTFEKYKTWIKEISRFIPA